MDRIYLCYGSDFPRHHLAMQILLPYFNYRGAISDAVCTSKNGLTRQPSWLHATCIAICIFLSGCDLNIEKENKVKETPAHITKSPTSNTVKARPNKIVIDDFYTNEEPLADKEPSVISKQLSTQVEIEGKPEPNSSLGGREADSNSLVEDLGFSVAQNKSIIDSLEPKPEELHCLSEQNQNENLPPSICERISKRLASVKLEACNAARLQVTGCNSVTGFPILVREFPPTEDRIPNGRILVIGGMHGDELTSVSVSLRWIEILNRYHSGLYHWHIAPMLNPDGVLKRAATRTNQNGVDLNRNMPSTDWEENAIKYASEPETQWLIDEINTFKPDAIISVHAPYGVVDFDSLLLNTAPKSLGKLHLNLLGTYPGSLGNYAGINRDIPVITLELPHSWVMPSEKETTKIWEDIVDWLQKNISNKVAKNES